MNKMSGIAVESALGIGAPVGVTVENVVKTFQDTPALHGVSLDVGAGELLALLGPSGSGKTTLLRILAGLDAPTAGRVLFGGEDAIGFNMRQRNVGFVFQHYALFRHMKVFDNVAFGLKVRPGGRRPSRAEIRRRVLHLLDLVQLSGLEHRYPGQLSGGQRQRVALARALAIEPRVLLLDEPFGALDAKVRKELRRWLRRLHDEMHVTSVFVTHDQEEAMEVADRVVVMDHGHIEQQGPPDEVYDHPATPFVLQFLGDVNLFHGRTGHAPGGITATGDGEVSYVRPHELQVLGQAEQGTIAATLSQTLTVGPRTRLEFRRLDDGSYVDVELPRADYVALRDRLTLATGMTLHLLPLRVTRFEARLSAAS